METLRLEVLQSPMLSTKKLGIAKRMIETRRNRFMRGKGRHARLRLKAMMHVLDGGRPRTRWLLIVTHWRLMSDGHWYSIYTPRLLS